jgi:hypothetical protein
MPDNHHARVLRMARKHLLPHLEFEPLTAKALVGLTGLARSSVNLGLKALNDAGHIYCCEMHDKAHVWSIPGWHTGDNMSLSDDAWEQVMAEISDAP